MIEFHIRTSSDQIETLSTDLQLFDVVAITVNDAKGEPIYEPPPGEVIYWQEVTLIAYFKDEHQSVIRHFLDAAQQKNQISGYQLETTPDKDWIKASYDLFKPMQIGERLLICPTWEMVTAHADLRTIVQLDPGLAFGTGTHPTTKLCLAWLEKNIQGNEYLLDYGCGSGILVVTALKLGAKQATAVDHDIQALQASRQNAVLNQVEHQLTTCLPEDFKPTQYDILIANILSSTIIQLLPMFSQCVKPGGAIVLSGILQEQASAVMQAYRAHFDMQLTDSLEEWVILTGVAHK